MSFIHSFKKFAGGEDGNRPHHYHTHITNSEIYQSVTQPDCTAPYILLLLTHPPVCHITRLPTPHFLPQEPVTTILPNSLFLFIFSRPQKITSPSFSTSSLFHHYCHLLHFPVSSNPPTGPYGPLPSHHFAPVHIEFIIDIASTGSHLKIDS